MTLHPGIISTVARRRATEVGGTARHQRTRGDEQHGVNLNLDPEINRRSVNR